MSNLFSQGQGRTAATTQPQAMGIDMQGAQYGPPVPVVYGQNRVPGNVIWYGDFRSVQHTQKAGKGFGGGGSSSYTYSASYLNGLCEGPIVGIANVWSGNSIVLLSTLAPFSATGTASQAPWSHLEAPANLSYAYTALFGVENMSLGGSPTLPNYNYEVAGLMQFGSGILDANPAAILTDLCTSATHGVPFNYLGDLTQYSDYCVANGLFLSPVYDQQSTAVQLLTDLFKATNAYPYFSEGVLKVVPLGDVAVTGNGVTYTPDVTPIVDLGAADFIVSGSESPVSVMRKAPQDCYNAVSLQFEDRANTYHNSGVVASIDEDMITNGARMAQTANINGCVTAAVARFIAQNMVQRAYYVRNTYTFKLSWRYCYLEPTDIVTLTDVNTGLNEFPVRILDVSEDAEGLLEITAEEFPEGIGHSAIYDTQPNEGTNLDPMADPGPVNAPFLMRAPGFLVSNNTPEIWCAVGGSNPLWGACDIYMSRDDTTYEYIGTSNRSARYGTLTAALPVGSDPDTTNTLAVQLYTPSVILGGTETDANNLDTLCIVDSEVLSYGASALTSSTPDSNSYNLTYLRRGAYASGNTQHAIGAPFARIDDSIFRVPIDPSIVGQLMYLKFLSINALGNTPRTLAEETAYPYTVGSNVELPDVPVAPQNFAVTLITLGAYLTWTNPVPVAVGATSIERAPDVSGAPGTFAVIGAAGPTANTFSDISGSGTFWYRIRSRGPLLSSGWSGYSAEVSADNGTYAPVGASRLQNGVPILPAHGRNLVPNEFLVNNNVGTPYNTPLALGAPSGDGWHVWNLAGGFQLSLANDAGFSSPYSLEASLGNVATVPTGTNSPSFSTADSFSVRPGATLLIGAHFAWYYNYAIPSGITIEPFFQIVFYNSAGTSVGNFGVTPGVNIQGYNNTAPGSAPLTASIVVPANTAYAVAYFIVNVSNTTGSPWVIPAGNNFPAIIACNGFFAYEAANLDSDVIDGSIYARPVGAYLNAGRPYQLWRVTGGEAVTGDNLSLHSEITSNIGGVGVPTVDLDSQVVDGSTYARVLGTALTTGHVDLSAGGVINKNLGYVADTATRFAAIQANADNTASNQSATTASLSNQTLDALPDGEVFLRLSNSVAVAEMLDNPDFEASSAIPPVGWTPGGVGVGTPASTSYLTGGAQYSGTQSLQFTGANSAGYTANRSFLTRPNDRWVLYAAVNNLSAVAGSAVAAVIFFNVNNQELGYGVVANVGAAAGWYVGSVVAQAPAGTVRMVLQIKNNVAGSNSVGFDQVRLVKQITDQRSLPQITVTNYRSKYVGPTTSYSATTSSATISVGAFKYMMGSITVYYNACSVTVTSVVPGVFTYFLYFEDPTYSGSTPVLQATKNGNDCYVEDGTVFLGSITVTFPTSGSGSGSGTGGGGWCVTDRMHMRSGLLAADVRAGDLLDCADWPTRGDARFERHLHSMERAVSECVLLRTDDGCALECSVTTPFDLLEEHHQTVFAPEMLGQRVLTDMGIATVIEVRPIGIRSVCRMHLGGISFAAGMDATRRIYSHNTTPAKP